MTNPCCIRRELATSLVRVELNMRPSMDPRVRLVRSGPDSTIEGDSGAGLGSGKVFRMRHFQLDLSGRDLGFSFVLVPARGPDLALS